MNGNPPKPPRRDLGYKILMGLLCLALIIFFAVLVLDFSGQNSLARYEQQWEAKGEHFDFASFVPQPVPDDQNFALTPIVASCYESKLDKNGHRVVPQKTDDGNRLKMRIDSSEFEWDTSTNTGNWATGIKANLKGWQLYYRELAAKTNEFPIPPQMQSPAADVLLALGKYDAAIKELRQAAALPDSRFPLNYDTEFPAEILLPHLAALKSCSLALQLRAIAELQNGQSDRALADVKLMLRLVESVRTEPFLISDLVRIAMLNITLQPVWEGLQDHEWTDAQLMELEQELARLDFLADYEFSMRGERASAMADIEYMRHTRKIYLLFESENTTPGIIQAAYHLVPNSVFYQNELAVARAQQEWFLPIVDVGRHSISPAQATLAQNKVEKLRSPWSPNNVIAAMLLPGLAGYAKKCGYEQSVVDMARIACALERCRLAQGAYPETLDALAPRFITSLPHDVVGGQPLIYRRTDDGRFALYSVGWNGTDDGGKVVLRENSKVTIDYDQGDWVWAGQITGGK